MDTTSDYSPLPDLVRVGDVLLTEHRQSPRSCFAAVQHVRPLMYDGSDRSGRFVRCHDLSDQGVSFWSPESFLTDRMVITFDNDDTPYELMLDVCHQTAITCLREPMYLIGCKFLGTNA